MVRVSFLRTSVFRNDMLSRLVDLTATSQPPSDSPAITSSTSIVGSTTLKARSCSTHSRTVQQYACHVSCLQKHSHSSRSQFLNGKQLTVGQVSNVDRVHKIKSERICLQPYKLRSGYRIILGISSPFSALCKANVLAKASTMFSVSTIQRPYASSATGPPRAA